MRDAHISNTRKPIFRQVAEKILHDMRKGAAHPGDALPGERVLAKKHRVSRGTVVEALDHLEQQHYIERLPAKGTFLTDEFVDDRRPARVVLPFPETRISPEKLQQENWGISSEIYRGMLDEAFEGDCEIIFHHFKEPQNELQLTRQYRGIKDYDGAVFIGHQLGRLRERFAATRKPCVMMVPPVLLREHEGVPKVSLDVERSFELMMAHLAQRGYRTCGVLAVAHGNPMDAENDQIKIAAMRTAARRHGIAVDDQRFFEFDVRAPEVLEEAIASLVAPLRKDGEVFFCANTDLFGAAYRLAAETRVGICRDFSLFAFATGVTFHNLIPAPTYVRINYYQMGRTACRLILDSIKTKTEQPTSRIVDNELVIGQSTQGGACSQ